MAVCCAIRRLKDSLGCGKPLRQRTGHLFFWGRLPATLKQRTMVFLMQAAQLLKFNKIQEKKAEAGGYAGNPFLPSSIGQH